jgi:hypothetical protein
MPAAVDYVKLHPERVVKHKLDQMQEFVLAFVRGLNTRLSDREDIITLEACSMFDPRPQSKEYNKEMRTIYLDHLFNVYVVPYLKQLPIKRGALAWFGPHCAFIPYRDSVLYHFGDIRTHSVVEKEFAEFALDMLKKLFCTACVEARFSTVSIAKSKLRSHLSTDKLRGYVFA